MSMNRARRFRVLERDSFRCLYCGSAAADVKLEVDHITPVSAGGSNAFTNLATACFDCNKGKGSGLLSAAEIEGIRRQATDLPEVERRSGARKPGPKSRHETPLNKVVRGCVQASEKAAIRDAAKASGMSESEWVREAVLEALDAQGHGESRAGIPGPPPTDRAVLVRDIERPGIVAMCAWDVHLLRWRLRYASVSGETIAAADWPERYRWCELPAFGGGA